MVAFRPPSPVLCVLLCVTVAVQRSDLRLAYVTHNSFLYYSCVQDPQPCDILSLTDSRLCLQSHSSPAFRRSLTVWFTSPLNVARLLNNSEVRHLTLIHCGTGTPGGMPTSSSPSSPPSFLEEHFAVQHLERLTVVNFPDGPHLPHRDRDTNLDLDLITDENTDPVDASASTSSAQIQDIFLDRELGAEYHEQARLGIIQGSVLEWGAAPIKAYTVQTHIDNNGALPFPDLHLPKLPETSVIYVSFVY